MKRTIEIVLSVIGILSYGILAALGGVMLFLQGDEGFLQEMIDEDPEMGLGDLEMLMEGMGKGGWLFITAAILAVILGVIAIYLMKGNKRPKTAGVIYLTVAIVVSLVTVGFGVIPGILYLIAGVMCFVRKPIRGGG